MSIESLQLNPVEMLAKPIGWNHPTTLDGNTTKYNRNFNAQRAPDSSCPAFIISAFNHVVEIFPKSDFRFNIAHELVGDTKLPIASKLGLHTDGTPIFLACSSDPTWIDEKGMFRQLNAGELAYIPSDMRHHAPLTIQEPGTRVRFKIFVNW